MKKSAKLSQPPKPDISLEHITPELAKHYLQYNPTNRNPVPSVVERYKRDMMNNRWRLSGDPIRFNSKGELIDGQHRLMACMLIGKPFETYVIRNLDEDVINVIDSGRARRPTDVLTIRGYPQAMLLAAATRWLLTMKAGVRSRTVNTGSMRPSHDEVVDFVERHPLLLDSIRACTSNNPSVGLPASILAAVHYVGSHHLVEPKPERANAFVDVFTKGIPDYPGDPAHKLREVFMREKLRRVYPSQEMTYSGAAYAWNLFAERKPVQMFRIPPEARIKGLLTEKL